MDLRSKKSLLQKVLTYARSELERLARSPGLPAEARTRYAGEVRTQPRVETEPSVQPTHEPRSESAASHVVPGTRASESVATTPEPRPPEPLASEPAASEDARRAAESDAVRGLEVSRSASSGLLTLRWSFTQADVSRAGALIDGNPVLCLRLVSFTKGRDDVQREVQDRPGVELTGELELAEPGQGAVVSFGLRSGERFVSIAHHVL